MNPRILLLIAAAILIAGGCATKRYGRLQAVSGIEKQHYSCEDIEVELGKIATFRKQIAEGSDINMASIGAFLVDLGIWQHNGKKRGGKNRLHA